MTEEVIRSNPPSTIKEELADNGGSTSCWLEEVAEVVKQLCSDKAPGIDEICPEMLRALAVEGLSWMTQLFKHCVEVWYSVKGVAEWVGGWLRG